MTLIHKKIIAIRKLRGLSQLQAADLSNISIRTYQRIESGQATVSIEYLDRIAACFDCSVQEVLHFDLADNEFSQLNDPDLSGKYQVLELENKRLNKLIVWLSDKLSIGGGQKKMNEIIKLMLEAPL